MSPLLTGKTARTSSPSFGLAKRRPLRVEGSWWVRSEKRKPKPALVIASASGSSGSSAPSVCAGTSSTRGSNESMAIMRSPSAILKSFCTGSP